MALILLIGAGGRLTRLVTGDKITEPLREWIGGDPTKNQPVWRQLAGYWVSCDWCFGLLAFAIVATSWFMWGDTRAWTAVAAALTGNLVYAGLTQAAAATSIIARQAITVLRPPARGR